MVGWERERGGCMAFESDLFETNRDLLATRMIMASLFFCLKSFGCVLELNKKVFFVFLFFFKESSDNVNLLK